MTDEEINEIFARLRDKSGLNATWRLPEPTHREMRCHEDSKVFNPAYKSLEERLINIGHRHGKRGPGEY